MRLAVSLKVYCNYLVIKWLKEEYFKHSIVGKCSYFFAFFAAFSACFASFFFFDSACLALALSPAPIGMLA